MFVLSNWRMKSPAEKGKKGGQAGAQAGAAPAEHARGACRGTLSLGAVSQRLSVLVLRLQGAHAGLS